MESMTPLTIFRAKFQSFRAKSLANGHIFLFFVCHPDASPRDLFDFKRF